MSKDIPTGDKEPTPEATTAFPVYDLHAHTSKNQAIPQALARAKTVASKASASCRTWHCSASGKAKQAGIKFTFGSDPRNERVGRLDYYKRIARLCGLTRADFFVPPRKA